KLDVCIVGGGPAGIILALDYCKLNPDKKTLLVEYGFEHQNNNNQLDDSILVENTVNHHNPYECTNKGLGGTTATWGGRCVMYDEIDFLQRPIIKDNCTWDINLFEDLKKYASTAAYYFECGDANFNIENIDKYK